MPARTTGRTRGPVLRAAATALLLAALTGGGLAGAAGAATAAKGSAADCAQLNTTLSSTVSSASGGDLFGKKARSVADNLGAMARKVSDKKLKKALLTMADFYDELSGVNSLTDAARISVRRAGAYVRALRVFTKASLACGAATVTVPSDT